MRWAHSYSIVDHELLHGRYLHRLSHQALSLYLFFVVVGDREGKSFYGETTICEILRLAPEQFKTAKAELESLRLIARRGAHVWVQNINHSRQHEQQQRTTKQNQVPERHRSLELPSDRAGSWTLASDVLTHVLRGSTESPTENTSPRTIQKHDR
jgi:hypothetical protein